MDIWQLKIVDAYLDTLWADMKNIRSGVTTLLHAAYGRDFGNYAGETRAKLRAHADSGIRAGYAVHTLDQHLFVYQDNAEFLASLPGDLGERIGGVLAEIGPATSADFFDLLESLVTEYAGHPRITIMACARRAAVVLGRPAREDPGAVDRATGSPSTSTAWSRRTSGPSGSRATARARSST